MYVVKVGYIAFNTRLAFITQSYNGFSLGRLPKVDLIILEGGMSVRTSVRPYTKSFFDFNEIWYIGRGR